MLKQWKIGMTFAGAVIGAGFASGQEILRFFVVYGHDGIVGALVAGMLFAFFGAVVLLEVHYKGFNSYLEVLEDICGLRIGLWIDRGISVFLLCGMCIMFAGSGAIFEEYLHLPYALGVCLTAVLVGIILMFGVNGVLMANTLLVPCLVLLCLAISLMGFFQQNGIASLQYNPIMQYSLAHHWLISAFLYVAYNMLIALAILSVLGREVDSGLTAWGSAFVGGFCLGIAALAIVTALLMYYDEVSIYQVPMLVIAGKFGRIIGSLYAWGLWIAMFNTAASKAYSLCKRLAGTNEAYYYKLIWVAVLAVVPFSFFGFARLVGILYPLFGYLGLIILLALALRFIRDAAGYCSGWVRHNRRC